MKKTRLILTICIILSITVLLSSCTAISTITGRNSDDFIYYGTAEADQIDISAEVAGKIKEIKVEEGQTVKAGDIIAVVDSPENMLKTQQSEISVENAKNELGKVQEGNRAEEIKAQQALVSQNEAQVKQTEALTAQADINMQNAKTTYDFKKKNYDDIKALYESSAATRQELDNAKYALDSAQYALNNSTNAYNSSMAQLDSTKAQAQAARERLKLLVNGATERTKSTAELGVAQAEKSYELTRLQLEKTNIIASVDGIVESVNFKTGEYITPGSAVSTMVNPQNMWVKIYVPEKILPAVKLNKTVSIKSDFVKDSTIKGKITYIAQEAEFTPMNIVTKKDRVKLVFAVKVELTEGQDKVKPGMLLDVDIR